MIFQANAATDKAGIMGTVIDNRAGNLKMGLETVVQSSVQCVLYVHEKLAASLVAQQYLMHMVKGHYGC